MDQKCEKWCNNSIFNVKTCGEVLECITPSMNVTKKCQSIKFHDETLSEAYTLTKLDLENLNI